MFLYGRRLKHLLAGKVKRLRKNLYAGPGSDPAGWRGMRERHYQLWHGYSRRINYRWMDVYSSVSGISDHRYVPEDIYYTAIEPRLNNKLFSKAWTDKNSYDLFFGGRVKMPEVVLRCIDGVLYSGVRDPLGRPEDHTAFPSGYNDCRLVIKPTMDSGGGKAVRVISLSGDRLTVDPPVEGVNSLPSLFSLYRGNFVVQVYIRQHPYFARFNESSLNTVRVLTYRRFANEEVVILHRLLRMGQPGSVVDNQASGGIACGISQEGVLLPFGVDKKGRRHSGSGTVDFGGAALVPFMKEVTETAIEVASCYRHSRLLGLDFAVNEKGEVILIEVNDSNNEINFFQMTSGPLFGDHTEEVAESCINMPRSFVIDYMI